MEDQRQPACLQIGQKVRLDGQTWTIARVGREVRLERRSGKDVRYKHSRVLERMVTP